MRNTVFFRYFFLCSLFLVHISKQLKFSLDAEKNYEFSSVQTFLGKTVPAG